MGTREGNCTATCIFAGTDDLPFPFSRLDSQHPEDLWDSLDTQRAAGDDDSFHAAKTLTLEDADRLERIFGTAFRDAVL